MSPKLRQFFPLKFVEHSTFLGLAQLKQWFKCSTLFGKDLELHEFLYTIFLGLISYSRWMGKKTNRLILTRHVGEMKERWYLCTH